MSGEEWTVERVAKVTDGDTVKLIRSRVMCIDGKDFRVTDVEPESIRLVWVDTPERGKPGYKQATEDLAAWIKEHADGLGEGLRVVCYDSGGWDRVMGDLIDADGASASQWLMVERGWPPYVEGK